MKQLLQMQQNKHFYTTNYKR